MAGELRHSLKGCGEGSLCKPAVLEMQRLGVVFALGQPCPSPRFNQPDAPIAVASTTFRLLFYLFQSMSIISSVHQRALQGSQAEHGPKER